MGFHIGRHQAVCLVMAVAITAGVLFLGLPWARAHVPGAALLGTLELKLMDWLFQQRGRRSPPADVVIAAIDEESIRLEGRWPWPRRRMADLVDCLERCGARAIVFDVLFLEPDRWSTRGPASDAALVRATRQRRNVFHAFVGDTSAEDQTQAPAHGLAAFRERAWDTRVVSKHGESLLAFQDVTPPLSGLTEAARDVGFVVLRDSGDGVLRFYDLLASFEGQAYPSLAMAVAAADLGLKPSDIAVATGDAVRLGDQGSLPLIADGAILLNFYGPSGTFPTLPATRILSGRVDRRDLAGRVVIVGATAKGVHELRPTPFGARFFGVEIQATALGNLLDGQGLQVADRAIDRLLVLAFGLIVGVTLPFWRPVAGSVLSVVLLVGYNAISVVLFDRSSYVMPMAAPNVALVLSMLTILSYRLATEERHRLRIKETFALFVPPEIVEQLAAEDIQLGLLRAERRQVTILFSDLRDFTPYSERHTPEDVVSLLNLYFTLMHGVVWKFGGTLDKYMGDGLMAFFGAPTAQEDHPQRAIQTAIEMQRQVALHREEWASLGMPDLRVAIGLHTGEALVGYAGSEGRMQYTCLGLVVNLAARLEETNRRLATDILISEALYDQVKDSVRAEPIGPVQLRGFSSEVEAYSVEWQGPAAAR